MTKYMLDTNIASYLSKGRNEILQHKVKLIPQRLLSISVVTEAEMRFGFELLPPDAKLRRLIPQFLDSIDIAPWDSVCAQSYARVAAMQRRVGKTLSQLDTMIAAHALALDLTLVTNDGAFRQVPGLRVEDWTQPQ